VTRRAASGWRVEKRPKIYAISRISARAKQSNVPTSENFLKPNRIVAHKQAKYGIWI
jgi:hypothetical protein